MAKVTLQTLLDIALVVPFTDFPTFETATADFSERAMAPRSYHDAQTS